MVEEASSRTTQILSLRFAPSPTVRTLLAAKLEVGPYSLTPARPNSTPPLSLEMTKVEIGYVERTETTFTSLLLKYLLRTPALMATEEVRLEVRQAQTYTEHRGFLFFKKLTFRLLLLSVFHSEGSMLDTAR